MGDRAVRLTAKPCSLRQANAWIAQHHSHHPPTRGHKFSIAAMAGDDLVGVVVCGRPVAAGLDDGFTMEVTRLCTIGHPNAASFLLGRVRRAAMAMGAQLLVSYTRTDEDGTCYRAAGWRAVAEVKGRGWNTGNKGSRWLPGVYAPTTTVVDRVRWETS